MFCAGCCGVSTLGATEVCWWVSFSFFSGGAIDALSARAVVATQGRARRSRKSNLKNNFWGSFWNNVAHPPPRESCKQASKQSVPYALRHSCGSNPRKTHKPRPRMQSNFEYEFTHHMGGTKTGRSPLCACLLRMGHVRVLCAIVAIAGYPHGRRLADRQLIELHEKADVPSTSIPAAGAPSIANFIHDTKTEQRAPQQGVSSAAVDVPPAAEPAFHFHYHDDDRSSRWNLPPPTPAP